MAELVLKGDVQMKRRLAALARKSPHAAGRALYEEGERIMTASKQIVPVATPELSGYSGGALRASGQVHTPDISATGAEVTLGYGGPGIEYAVYVHEIPPPPAKSRGGRSARHMPPTQWKYLEQPFKAAVRGMAARLARRLRREIR